MKLLFLTTTLLSVTVAAEENLFDTFISTFSGATREETRELLDTLHCKPQTSNLFSDVLRDSLNTTRTCTRNGVTRENAKKCIEKAIMVTKTVTSPYDAFLVQRLDAADKAKLGACADGLGATEKADIVAAFEVIVKRFVGCAIELTDAQKDQVFDFFKGTEQAREMSRAQLSTICNSLQFSGNVHADLVEFVSDTLKTFTVVLPQSRR